MASPCFEAQGDPQRIDETNKDTQSFTILTRDLPETYRLGSFLLLRKWLIHKITWSDHRRITSRTCISQKCLRPQPSHVGRQESKQKGVLFEIFLRKQCVGLNKSRWQLLQRILRRRGQLVAILKLRDTWCKDRFLPGEDHPKFDLQEKSKSSRAEGSIRWPIPSRKTDRMNDLSTLLAHRHSWDEEIQEYSDPFNIILASDVVQGFDIRWDEVLLLLRKIPLINISSNLV